MNKALDNVLSKIFLNRDDIAGKAHAFLDDSYKEEEEKFYTLLNGPNNFQLLFDVESSSNAMQAMYVDAAFCAGFVHAMNLMHVGFGREA